MTSPPPPQDQIPTPMTPGATTILGPPWDLYDLGRMCIASTGIEIRLAISCCPYRRLVAERLCCRHCRQLGASGFGGSHDHQIA
jgi:hypothetical protein